MMKLVVMVLIVKMKNQKEQSKETNKEPDLLLTYIYNQLMEVKVMNLMEKLLIKKKFNIG